MTRILRVMKPNAQGEPASGSSATTLGVRVPRDIRDDSNQNVHPGTGGMSVSPRLADLPSFLVPRRLRTHCTGAAGNDNHHVWRLAQHAFTQGPIEAELYLRPDRPGHGVMEPCRVVPLTDYRAFLDLTAPSWSVDESAP